MAADRTWPTNPGTPRSLREVPCSQRENQARSRRPDRPGRCIPVAPGPLIVSSHQEVADDPLDLAALVGPDRLATCERLAETASTMDRAREIAADPASPLPCGVVADRQLEGRGRRGARWWQPAGSLAASIIVAGDSPGGGPPPPAWSLACGVAVAETIRGLEPTVAAMVRWPNDVEVAGRKLAGILVEAAGGQRVIFGIGVNTTGSATAAPPAIAGRVATLPDLVGRSLPRSRLLEPLVPRLLGLLTSVRHEPAILADRYRPLCCLTGRRIRVHVGGEPCEGRCDGIAPDGRLILDSAGGRILIASGSLTPPEEVWRGDV
jgi:BirA family transcriptional regulator, biotin operon repressor / biotin---[acetyl-CoA-carboxylase] ligase